MKKLFLIVAFIMATSVGFVSCNESVEVSPDMAAFMEVINSSKSIDEAAAKYGYSNDDMPLAFYDVKEPSVTASITEDGETCYDLNVKHGDVDSDITVCWSAGKIVSISLLSFANTN